MKMSNVLKAGLLTLAAVFSLIAISAVFGLELHRYVLPKKMEIQREAWEESQSRMEGLVMDIRKHKRDFLKKKEKLESLPEDSDRRSTVKRHMDAIAASVRHRAADLDKDDLKDHPQLEDFVEKMRER